MFTWIGVFLVPVPAFWWLCALVLGSEHRLYGAALFLCKASVAIGGVLAGILAVLLMVEFFQDRYMDRFYTQRRGKRVRLAGGLYECQYCGCQQVKEFDRRCPACNRELE